MEKLRALEAGGRAGAVEAYQTACMAALAETDWLNAEGEYVVPACRAQLLVAGKASGEQPTAYHRTI